MAIERWRHHPVREREASSPDLTFLQLLLGYRSLAELQYTFVDCLVANDEAQVLLQTLFPKQVSDVWALS